MTNGHVINIEGLDHREKTTCHAARDEYRLRIEIEAVRLLLQGLADLEDPADEELWADMIEGETNLHEALETALEAIDEEEALLTGVDAKLKDWQARKAALRNRIERKRGLIEQALAVAGPDGPLRLAGATLSLARRAPDVVILEEADIPADYFVPQPPPPPKLDKKALREALRARAEALQAASAIADADERQNALAQVERSHPPIPGADLDNGGYCLMIRRR